MRKSLEWHHGGTVVLWSWAHLDYTGFVESLSSLGKKQLMNSHSRPKWGARLSTGAEGFMACLPNNTQACHSKHGPHPIWFC